ncbi:MAG: trehalose utilization protein [Planctomycetes bacterium]|nr:trehalose utilization protein [Planctomycetota bacterium]
MLQPDRRRFLAWTSGAGACLAARGGFAGETRIRVVVWDEQQPAQKQAYDNFLGNAIADHLSRQPGLRVIAANIDQPEKGLPAGLLDSTDVLVWWGHVRQGEISEERAKDIVARIKRGQLALIALHSAHWSAPFIEAMHERTRDDARRRYPDPASGPAVKFEFVAPEGRFVPTADSLVTPAYYAVRRGAQLTVRVDLPNCVFPAYRADGKPSLVKVLNQTHPIAQGLPESFEIPQTEMYADPFHVPLADETLFEERWSAGESFRSGQIWKLGDGRVFYFRPGHETYPVYKQELPLRVVSNAVNWLGSKLGKSP